MKVQYIQKQSILRSEVCFGLQKSKHLCTNYLWFTTSDRAQQVIHRFVSDRQELCISSDVDVEQGLFVTECDAIVRQLCPVHLSSRWRRE